MPDPSDARLALTPSQQSHYEAIADTRDDVAVTATCSKCRSCDPVVQIMLLGGEKLKARPV